MIFGTKRMSYLKQFFAVISSLIFATSVSAELSVGDVAPDFTLTGSDGNQYTLSEMRGKHVVVAFFPKAYTSGWTLECKALRDSDREIRKYEVAYFMASTDEERVNRGFAEKNGATFPILSDPDKSVCTEYGVLYPIGLARRWTFYIGPDGIIQRIDKDVKPRTAGAQLVENLQDLNVPVVGGE